ncbi:MAG: hypothetical protein PUP92_30000 [Rhizonema sp. PD38]|nr:hypothetical protein [Rhizonema sp. PD38]
MALPWKKSVKNGGDSNILTTQVRAAQHYESQWSAKLAGGSFPRQTLRIDTPDASSGITPTLLTWAWENASCVLARQHTGSSPQSCFGPYLPASREVGF